MANKTNDIDKKRTKIDTNIENSVNENIETIQLDNSFDTEKTESIVDKSEMNIGNTQNENNEFALSENSCDAEKEASNVEITSTDDSANVNGLNADNDYLNYPTESVIKINKGIVLNADDVKSDSITGGKQNDNGGGIDKNDTIKTANIACGAINDNAESKAVKTLDDIDDNEPISDKQRIEEAFKTCPPDKCKRDNALDKKINNYGTGIAIVMFLIAIVISIFNMKSMRFPVSFLFLGLGALVMAGTATTRRRNNQKCGCNICATQAKTLFTSSILFGLLGIAGIIAFIVMTVLN